MPVVKKSSYQTKTEEYERAILCAMTAKRVDQARLAARLRKSQSAVSRKLRDIDKISFGEMREIASFLGLEINIGEKGK